MARPSKLTDTLAEQSAVCVREGIDPQIAVGAYGISRSTYYSWIAQGREGYSPFMEFLDLIERARYEAIYSHVSRIYKSALAGNWRAATWWLERHAPELYGKEYLLALFSRR